MGFSREEGSHTTLHAIKIWKIRKEIGSIWKTWPQWP